MPPQSHSGTQSIRNPNTPLAFFDPAAADRLEVSRYIFVGCTAVMVWDVIIRLPKDFFILRHRGFSLPVIAYIVSRLSTLSWMLSGTIVTTANLTPDCARAINLYTWQYTLAISSTSLLFYLRVRAVYASSPPSPLLTSPRFINTFFGLLWVLTAGSAFVVPSGVKARNMGPTRYCYISALERYVGVSVMMPFIHDTLVFVAITRRILMMRNKSGDDQQEGGDGDVVAGAASNGSGGNQRGTVKAQSPRSFREIVLGGAGLPDLSRAIFKDGQIYYFTISVLNFLALSTILSSLPSPYKTLATIANALLTNVMASIVFRRTVMLLIKEKRRVDVDPNAKVGWGLGEEVRTVGSPVEFRRPGGGHGRGGGGYKSRSGGAMGMGGTMTTMTMTTGDLEHDDHYNSRASHDLELDLDLELDMHSSRKQLFDLEQQQQLQNRDIPDPDPNSSQHRWSIPLETLTHPTRKDPVEVEVGEKDPWLEPGGSKPVKDTG